MLPLIAAVAVIPPLLRALGDERFGLLTIVWVLVGYFSLIDLGLGRALTRAVAEGMGSHAARLDEVVWSSAVSLLVIGVVAGALSVVATPVLVDRVLLVPSTLRDEASIALYAASLSIPVVVLTAAVRGLLEANQRFGAVNAVRVPSAIFTYVGPLAVVTFTQNLGVVVGALVLGRVATLVALTFVARRSLPGLLVRTRVQPGLLRELLRTGAWMTVSNLVAPLMLTFDRVIIASILSVAAVAYYATPYEVVTKIWIIPGAISAVMFPAFATAAAHGSDHSARLYRRAQYYLVLVTFPMVLAAVVFAPSALQLWVGPDFAAISAPPAEIIGIGVFFSCVSLIAFTLVQATHRPAIPAILQLVELPLYLGLAVILINSWGLVGAAVAWSARIFVDALALMVIAQRITARPVTVTLGWLFLTVLGLSLPLLTTDIATRGLIAAVVAATFAVIMWTIGRRTMNSTGFGCGRPINAGGTQDPGVTL